MQYLTVSVSTCASVSAVRDFSLRYRVCKLPTSSMCLTNTRSLIVNLCYYFILLSKAYWFLVKRVGLLCHFYFNAPVILDVSTLIYSLTTLYIIMHAYIHIYILLPFVPTDSCTCLCCRSLYVCSVNTLKIVQFCPELHLSVKPRS